MITGINELNSLVTEYKAVRKEIYNMHAYLDKRKEENEIMKEIRIMRPLLFFLSSIDKGLYFNEFVIDKDGAKQLEKEIGVDWMNLLESIGFSIAYDTNRSELYYILPPEKEYD